MDYIGGRFVKITDPNGEIFSRNPSNLSEPAVAFEFSFEHTHNATVSARRSFGTWKRLNIEDRIRSISKYRDCLKTHAEELERSISVEVGTPLWETRNEFSETLSLVDYYIDNSVRMWTKEAELLGDLAENSGSVRFSPRGVFAILPPAIQPLLQLHKHLIPTLIFGNTTVIKPSKYTPRLGQILANLVHESEIPAGVLNIIFGDSEVSRRLAMHPDIDGISYTGTYETGLKIKKQIINDYWKILLLEAGGKNALIVWDDCDYDRALKEAFLSAFVEGGQRCTSISRIIVHRKLADRFISGLHGLAKSCRIGDPLVEDPIGPFMGPLVSESALENYLRYQGIAVREGCEEIMRGKPLERDKKGYYVSPSLHFVKNSDPKSMYQNAEIHGPNVALFTVNEIEEAIDIINQPKYGLLATIYTKTQETFLRVMEEAKVGLVYWNRMSIEPSFKLPSGGIKKSGTAHPMGSFAIHQCTYPVSSLTPVEQPSKILDLAPIPEH